ncbi:hypothetical protein GCM10011321_25220 [Youhaiella tibetensis]|nr:hypothetical protein GCM10011321_25220 [Youhaiella tibetensis]
MALSSLPQPATAGGSANGGMDSRARSYIAFILTPIPEMSYRLPHPAALCRPSGMVTLGRGKTPVIALYQRFRAKQTDWSSMGIPWFEASDRGGMPFNHLAAKG